MNRVRHYARAVEFDRLVGELEAARADRLVYARTAGPLELWCYTTKAIYDRAWSPIVAAARGLVLNRQDRRVIATPFPKFFNVGEPDTHLPDEPFEVFEKVDGSLIIIFHDGDRWRAATKGSLESPQVVWAEGQLALGDLSALRPGTTYLAEAVYPENQIVIKYSEEGLVLLAAYDETGAELNSADVQAVAAAVGWRSARQERYSSLSNLMERCQDLPENEEGFVLRFHGGLRLKMKGAAYRRIHAAIARVTPLNIWEAWAAGEDLEKIRRGIPEEFWWDFDEIHRLLEQQLHDRITAANAAAEQVAHLSDKEVGLMLKTFPSEVAPYLFQLRRNPDLMQDKRTRDHLLKSIRPQGNELAGYAPSYGLRRVVDEE